VLDALWRLVFPARCLGCGRRDQVLCPGCRATITPLAAAVCPCCASPERLGAPCRRCRARPGALDALVAATSYQGVVRQAILKLKFGQAHYLAPVLVEILVETLDRRPLAADVLVPVPLSRQRQRERGYNQAALLAVELLRRHALGGAALEAGVLERVRHTPPQVRLRAPERRRNVREAFACPRPEVVNRQRVLLLDDVSTTGATLEACAAALKAAGASRVMALVVAKDL
jgi:ComF family protein